MSNPIKSLLPTPLSMQFISYVNALCKLPLPLYKFFIDCALSTKSSSTNIRDQNLLASILKRQKIDQSIASGSINAVKLLEHIAKKVLKLMRTSEPEQVQGNLQNCQKYVATVLTENTLIDEIKVNYLVEKLATFIQKSLEVSHKKVQTRFGNVQWSIFNLKKTALNSQSYNSSSPSKNKEQTSEDSGKTNLRTINKMYVKLSFGNNFTTSQIQKLIGSGFQSTDCLAECRLQRSATLQNSTSTKQSNRPQTVTMSLIDFRLFMEELDKVKNLNY